MTPAAAARLADALVALAAVVREAASEPARDELLPVRSRPLGCAPGWLRARIAAGELAAVRGPRAALLVREADVAALFASRRVAPRAPEAPPSGDRLADLERGGKLRRRGAS